MIANKSDVACYTFLTNFLFNFLFSQILVKNYNEVDKLNKWDRINSVHPTTSYKVLR